jgi:predicted permease
VLLVATAVNLILLGIGQIFYIAMGKTGSARLARYSVVILHATFMGVPVIDALFGAIGNMYYAIFMIPLRLLYYGFSKIMLTPPGAGESAKLSGKTIAKAFLTPSIIIMPFAIAFGMLGIHLPAPVANCISNMAKLCSPLGLILCGTVIAKYDIKKLFCLRYMRMPLVRNIAMPALIWLITLPLYRLGIDKIIIQMAVIYSAFPIASLLPTFILQYDPDPDVQFEAASITIIATLLSMITVPFWCFVVQSAV